MAYRYHLIDTGETKNGGRGKHCKVCMDWGDCNLPWINLLLLLELLLTDTLTLCHLIPPSSSAVAPDLRIGPTYCLSTVNQLQLLQNRSRWKHAQFCIFFCQIFNNQGKICDTFGWKPNCDIDQISIFWINFINKSALSCFQICYSYNLYTVYSLILCCCLLILIYYIYIKYLFKYLYLLYFNFLAL